MNQIYGACAQSEEHPISATAGGSAFSEHTWVNLSERRSVRPHFTTKTVPAVALGIVERGFTWKEILMVRTAG